MADVLLTPGEKKGKRGRGLEKNIKRKMYARFCGRILPGALTFRLKVQESNALSKLLVSVGE